MSNQVADPSLIEDDEDEDFLKPRKPNMDDELDITPMIDITFLLLIFFIVSSKMNAEQTVDLPKARHGGAISAKESAIILMRRGTDLAEVVKADGTKFSSDVEQQNAEITDYVQQELDSGKKFVVVKAEGSVRHGEVSRVVSAISESLEDGAMINIAVMEQD